MRNKTTPTEIIEYVASRHGMTLDELFNCQESHCKMCKKYAIFLVYKGFPGVKFEDVSKVFQDMDVDKVEAAINKIQKIIDEPNFYKGMSGEIKLLADMLKISIKKISKPKNVKED